MQLSENALKVLSARYLIKDIKGKITETPDEMFRRVALNTANAEKLYGDDPKKWADEFYEIMSSLRFLPNSPTLMNSGRPQGQLAACFVLPVEDSMRGIFETLKNAALILQSGGGTGFSFSRLRHKRDIVSSTGGVASGPVSFMKIYNTATDVIKQGGARRGANMGILRVDHPDILEFVRLKRLTDELHNFNISVAITDEFMNALKDDAEYNLINPRDNMVVRTIRAKTVFDEIVHSAWATGDPGLIFIDRINRSNPTPHLGSIESTNPCGEQPLLPYEACVLGSINISAYLKEDCQWRFYGISEDELDYTLVADSIDWGALKNDINTSVRFLDDVIDVNIYPILDVELMHKGNRKIGLGVMGWADLLILLGLSYGDEKSIRLAKDIMRFIQDESRKASAALASKRGAFPNFKGSVYETAGMPAMRNATLTTIAPTGTLALIADCSSGIEPIFSLAHKRFIMDSVIVETNKYFIAAAKKFGFFREKIMKRVYESGSIRGIKSIPLRIRKVFRNAVEIPYEAHVEMQAAFQGYTDNAVSKTINLPHKASQKDVARAFMLAYNKGVKGITVFRYGSIKGTLVKFQDSD
jgi:ribonucleoside-diphosphate reductase alpha chain